MKVYFKVFAGILLSIVGFTALYGGWALMIDPSGHILNMPVGSMKFSPFDDYLIPGAILFFVPGVGSLALLPIGFRGLAKASSLLILAGMVVSAWIVTQITIMHKINWLGTFYIAIALMLLFIGIKSASTTIKN
jgi:hypothetical protein